MAKGKDFKKPSNRTSKRFQTENLEPLPNYDLHKPVFSLKYMRYQRDHCISKCETESKSLIIDTFLRLSQFTWSQLRTFPKNIAFEQIPHYRFKASFPAVITPEVPVLVARYDDGGRIAGFREKDIFHVVLAGKDLYSH